MPSKCVVKKGFSKVMCSYSLFLLELEVHGLEAHGGMSNWAAGTGTPETWPSAVVGAGCWPLPGKEEVQ